MSGSYSHMAQLFLHLPHFPSHIMVLLQEGSPVGTSHSIQTWKASRSLRTRHGFCYSMARPLHSSGYEDQGFLCPTTTGKQV